MNDKQRDYSFLYEMATSTGELPEQVKEDIKHFNQTAMDDPEKANALLQISIQQMEVEIKEKERIVKSLKMENDLLKKEDEDLKQKVNKHLDEVIRFLNSIKVQRKDNGSFFEHWANKRELSQYIKKTKELRHEDRT